MGRPYASDAKAALLEEIAAADPDGYAQPHQSSHLSYLINHDLVTYDAAADRYHVTEAGRGAVEISSKYTPQERELMLRVIRAEAEELVECLPGADFRAIEKLITDGLIDATEIDGRFGYVPTPDLINYWEAHAVLCGSRYYRRRQAAKPEEISGVTYEMFVASERKCAQMAAVIDQLQQANANQRRRIEELQKENDGLREAVARKNIHVGKSWEKGA